METVVLENETHKHGDSDVTITSGSQTYQVHAVVLRDQSGYFKEMIPDPEDIEEKPFTLDIEESLQKPAVLEKILNSLYTGRIELDNEEITEILEAFDTLKIQNDKLQRTVSNSLNFENWHLFITPGESDFCKSIADSARCYAADHYQFVNSTDTFQALSADEKREIQAKLNERGKHMKHVMAMVLLHTVQPEDGLNENVICYYDDTKNDWFCIGTSYATQQERFSNDPVFTQTSTSGNKLFFMEKNKADSVSFTAFNTKTSENKSLNSTTEISQASLLTCDDNHGYLVSPQVTKNQLTVSVFGFGESAVKHHLAGITLPKDSATRSTADTEVTSEVVDVCCYNGKIYVLLLLENKEHRHRKSCTYKGVLLELSTPCDPSISDTAKSLQVSKETSVSNQSSMKPTLRLLTDDKVYVAVLYGDEATFFKYEEGELEKIWGCHDFPTAPSRVHIAMVGCIVYTFDVSTTSMRFYDTRDDSYGALKLPGVVTMPWHIVRIAALDVPKHFAHQGKTLTETQLQECIQLEDVGEFEIDTGEDSRSSNNVCTCLIYPVICCCFPCLACYVYCVEHKPLQINDFRRAARLVSNLLWFPFRCRQRRSRRRQVNL